MIRSIAYQLFEQAQGHLKHLQTQAISQIWKANREKAMKPTDNNHWCYLSSAILYLNVFVGGGVIVC